MISVKLHGVEMAQKALAEISRKIDPVMRGALNTTATKARSEIYVKGLSGTLKGARVRGALRIKRAKTGRMNSRIIPSGSGILVPDYMTWGYDEISRTRARIWVRGPKGRKIAAGFVNPSSAKKLPLATRSEKRTARKTYKYKMPLTTAMGPSAAYWFKQLTDSQAISWVNTYLQQEFRKRLQLELKK